MSTPVLRDARDFRTSKVGPSRRANLDEPWLNVVVNRTLATQLFGAEDPIGQRVAPRWTGATVRACASSGSSATSWGGNPTMPAPPAVYFPVQWNWQPSFSVMVKSAGRDPYALLPDVRRAVERLNREIPIYSLRSLGEIADDRLGSRGVANTLFAVFAALALGLGAVGIYGVMSYRVTQRARELGLRIALGASKKSVLSLVLVQGGRLILPGIAVGLVLASGGSRLLSGMLYGVGSLDPLTYVGAALALRARGGGRIGNPSVARHSLRPRRVAQGVVEGASDVLSK